MSSKKKSILPYILPYKLHGPWPNHIFLDFLESRIVTMSTPRFWDFSWPCPCPRHVSQISRWPCPRLRHVTQIFPCPRHVFPKTSCPCHVHDRGVDMDTGVHLVRVHDHRTLLVTQWWGTYMATSMLVTDFGEPIQNWSSWPFWSATSTILNIMLI